MLTRKKINPYQLPPAVLAKWEAPLLDEGFVPIPKRLLRTVGALLKGAHAIDDLAIVLAIADYQRPNLQRPPSLEYLAFNAGLTVEDARERIRSLQERGLVMTSGPEESIAVSLAGLQRKAMDLSVD